MRDILIERNLEPLRELIDNLSFKEVVITRPRFIKVETLSGEWKTFENEKITLSYLYGLCRLLATKEGKRFGEDNPILAATIDDKHRVNAIFGKQTNHDISVVIRLKRNSGIGLEGFILSDQEKANLINAVKERKTILISGGTGTGKTTLLNALVKFISSQERIITIENVREIEIDPAIHDNHDALIYLEDQEDRIKHLLNTSLRMRPDRIIIGELRIENSDTFLRAANTGHQGTISTIHANTPQGAIDALVHNIKSSGHSNRDEERIRDEISKNIDLIVQLQRKYDSNKMSVEGYLWEVKK